MQRTICAALVTLAIAATAASTVQRPSGATIRGRVEVRGSPPAIAQRPNVGALGAPNPHDTSDRRRSVVYLEMGPRAAFDDTELPRARMNQRNETFVPRVLAIMTGTTVEFPNDDPIYHNVFSLSRARGFDLGRYAAGHSKSVRFDRPGIVRVFCDIHSHMSAFILVFAHPFFAVTDDRGQYAIRNVPPGKYTLKAWHEVLPEVSRPVTVGDETNDVELNLVLSRAEERR
jgi:plastocyanin